MVPIDADNLKLAEQLVHTFESNLNGKKGVLLKKLNRSVLGPVVDNQNLDIDAINFLLGDTAEELNDGRFLVVGRDDD